MPPKSVMRNWVKQVKKYLKDWQDLAYNTFNASRDYWSFDEITWMPITNLLDWIDFLSPHLKEEAKRRQQQMLEDELTGKRRKAAYNRANKRH